MSTTPPNQPQEPEPEPDRPRDESAEAREALRNLGDKPRADEIGETAYSAVPPPLPTTGDPAQGPVQDAIPGSSEQPQQPYQQQSPYQQPQQPYGAAPPYAGAQQAQYGSAGYGGGPYQADPPPPQYGQGYGYPGAAMPPGMPPLADWGQRAAAFLLDNGVAIVAGWIAGGSRSNTVDVVFGLISLAGAVWAIINAVRAGREGQSYGKRLMGIRLARLADGRPIGGGLGFLRLFLNWLLWVACVIPGVLNLVWPLWDRMNQTWSDKIAKSVVVKAR